MPNPDLIAYVKEVLSRGFSQDEVRRGLLKSGYAASDVDVVLSLFPKPLSFGRRWRLALTDPSGLFAQIKDEHGLGEALSFLLKIAALAGLLVVVPVFVFLALSFADVLPAFLLGQSVALVAVALYVSFVVQSVIGVFVNAAIVHVFARLMAGQGSFNQAFKSAAYAQGWWLPGALFVAIPVVGVFAFSLTVLFVEIVGVGALYGLSRKRSVLAVLSPILLVTAVLIVFSFLSAGLLFAGVGLAVASPEMCVEKGGEWCFAGSQGSSCGSRDDCLTYVAVDLESARACDMIVGQSRRDICYGTLAINLDDVSLCKRASDRGECERFFTLLG